MLRFYGTSVFFCLVSLQAFTQEKNTIPGVVPISLSKREFEINSYYTHCSYKTIQDTRLDGGAIQLTYGLSKKINIGLDVSGINLTRLVRSGGSSARIIYRVLNVGPRIRWPLFTSNNERHSLTIQNSLIFPLKNSFKSDGNYTANVQVSADKPISVNQFIYMGRVNYDFFVTMQVDVNIYPKIGDESVRPITTPLSLILAYAFSTRWMIFGISNYQSEFKSVDWAEPDRYYQTSGATSLGLGIQHSLSKDFMSTLTYTAPIQEQTVSDENWLATKALTIAIRWKI